MHRFCCSNVYISVSGLPLRWSGSLPCQSASPAQSAVVKRRLHGSWGERTRSGCAWPESEWLWIPAQEERRKDKTKGRGMGSRESKIFSNIYRTRLSSFSSWRRWEDRHRSGYRLHTYLCHSMCCSLRLLRGVTGEAGVFQSWLQRLLNLRDPFPDISQHFFLQRPLLLHRSLCLGLPTGPLPHHVWVDDWGRRKVWRHPRGVTDGVKHHWNELICLIGTLLMWSEQIPEAKQPTAVKHSVKCYLLCIFTWDVSRKTSDRKTITKTVLTLVDSLHVCQETGSQVVYHLRLHWIK